jgi:hypothetical protein
MTKKVSLLVAAAGAAASLIAIYLFESETQFCRYAQIDLLNDSYNICAFVASLSFVFMPVFIFSLVFFFIKNENIFQALQKFTFIYLLLSRDLQSQIFLIPHKRVLRGF